MANQIDVYRLPAPTLATPVAVAGGTLVNGTTYYYVVKPIRGIGAIPGAASSYDHVVGSISNEVSFTATATNKSCKLDWTDSDGIANGWHIFRTTVSGSYATTTHLTNVNAKTYTDTGIATATTATSFNDQTTIDVPLINVRGAYIDSTVPAGTTTISGFVMTFYTGSFVVNSLVGRAVYFAGGTATFTDASGRVLKYAKVKSNTASAIVFQTQPTTAPTSGDVYKVSWNYEDIYSAVTALAPAPINALMPYRQAGQPLIVKSGLKNYMINAFLAVNGYDVGADWGFLSMHADNVEFGQLCRFKMQYSASLYAGDCFSDAGSPNGGSMIFNTGNSAKDTMQSGSDFFGAYDINGLHWEVKSSYPTIYSNDSIQPQWGAQPVAYYACYRHCGSTFVNARAMSPALATIFKYNTVAGNGPEESSCETDGMVITNNTSNAIRLNSIIESRSYNTTILGGQNAIDMYVYDGDSAHLINPAPSTLAKCLGSTATDSVHWEITPNAGTLWIDYQLGFTIKDASNDTAIENAMVEIFDKDGNPLYADIGNRRVVGKEQYYKGGLSVSSIIRNMRGAFYPIVSVPEYRPSVYIMGRYYGYTNTALKLTIGEKGAVAGQWGSYVSPTLNIPAQLYTGYVFTTEGEQNAPIDKNKIYLSHMSGDFKYVGYIGTRSTLPTDGLGLKTTAAGVDEGQVNLPTGYGSVQYTNYIAIEGRRFLTDANGRIPLLDFKAISLKYSGIRYGNIISYKTPWTIKITKEGYETSEFKLSPSGLYGKEFNIALKPQIPKFEDDNGNVFDRVDKTNSGTTNIRRKIVKAA